MRIPPSWNPAANPSTRELDASTRKVHAHPACGPPHGTVIRGTRPSRDRRPGSSGPEGPGRGSHLRVSYWRSSDSGLLASLSRYSSA